MTLRGSFRPLRPDLDRFLFATVEDEIDGIPLSVISALTRLGLDPWQEAGRLSSLSNREAVEELALWNYPVSSDPWPRHEKLPTASSNFSRDTTPTVGPPCKSKFARATSDRRRRVHPNSG